MKLEDKLRSDIAGKHLVKLPSILQGISKELISTVLQALDRKKRDCVDAVWALLDNINPNWFYEAAKKGLKFSDGASTGHIAIHVGVYQRGGTKLDREGRDYWLKPLWEIGALEKVYFDPENATFLPGHPVAKSPNSAYRIAPSFLEILRSPPSQQPGLLRTWVTDEAVRARLQIQERLAEKTREEVGSPHQDLINAACEAYAPTFLPGFEVIYIDSTDGQRVTPKQEASLKAAGVAFSLGDSIPDVLLWNRTTDELWVIEAVTSDGEVDRHKLQNLTALANRSGKKGIGFTTAYRTWRDAASRQSRHKNIAPGTFIWIREDPGKHFSVQTFPRQPRLPHR